MIQKSAVCGRMYACNEVNDFPVPSPTAFRAIFLNTQNNGDIVPMGNEKDEDYPILWSLSLAAKSIERKKPIKSTFKCKMN